MKHLWILLVLMISINFSINADSRSISTNTNNNNSNFNNNDSFSFSLGYYIIIFGLFITNLIVTIVMIKKNYIPQSYHCMAIVLLFILPYFSSLIMWCVVRRLPRASIVQGVVVQEVVHVQPQNIQMVSINLYLYKKGLYE